jgi:hypothetical protein
MYDIKSCVLNSTLVCAKIIRLMITHYWLPLKQMRPNSPEYWAVFIYCKNTNLLRWAREPAVLCLSLSHDNHSRDMRPKARDARVIIVTHN